MDRSGRVAVRQANASEVLAVDYTIDAIPTRYCNVLFRSKLEATWAAYFDLHGIDWSYEPCFLRGWRPDFQLETPHCTPPLLAEVKPVGGAGWSADAGFKKTTGANRTVLLLGRNPSYVELVPMGDCKYRNLQNWLSARGVVNSMSEWQYNHGWTQAKTHVMIGH
jgi:hypothetical protein